MTALLLSLALACSESCDSRAVEDAAREDEAATACDLTTLREEQHRVRVEIAKATRPDEQSRLWREFDGIADAIKRCGTRT